MNDENHSSPSSCPSCAWPLVTLLTALLVVNLVQLVSIVQERASVNQMAGNAQQAITRISWYPPNLKTLPKT